MLEVVHGVIRKLFTIRQITIAVVRGACLGGGWELASSCDLVLASEESSFATPEITVGCYPPRGLSSFSVPVGLPSSGGDDSYGQEVFCSGGPCIRNGQSGRSDRGASASHGCSLE